MTETDEIVRYATTDLFITWLQQDEKRLATLSEQASGDTSSTRLYCDTATGNRLVIVPTLVDFKAVLQELALEQHWDSDENVRAWIDQIDDVYNRAVSVFTNLPDRYIEATDSWISSYVSSSYGISGKIVIFCPISTAESAGATFFNCPVDILPYDQGCDYSFPRAMLAELTQVLMRTITS